MKRFNETEYKNEFSFNVQCDGDNFHLIITEGLFADCKEKAYCVFSEEEMLSLIEFLTHIRAKADTKYKF